MSYIIMNCTSSSLPMNSTLAESCSSTYQSICELQCQESFIGIRYPSYVVSCGQTFFHAGRYQLQYKRAGAYTASENALHGRRSGHARLHHICVMY